VVQSNVTFNQGLYTPAEVALFAKLHRSTVQRWFFGNSMGRPVLPAAATEEKTLGFLDFVQALAVRDIRRVHKIPLPKIRAAVQRAEHDYRLTHIFARPHCSVLFDGDIFIYPEGESSPVQVSGKHPHQIGLRQIVEPFQRDLSFDERGLANLFTAYRYADEKVVIDPAVRFGEPCVPSCGYSARTLHDAVLSEGGVPQAAKAFGVPEAAVDVALRYYESLELAA
jgi:uncharacterized protein (DUF433 family)